MIKELDKDFHYHSPKDYHDLMKVQQDNKVSP